MLEDHNFTDAHKAVRQNSMDVGELYSQLFREWVPTLPTQQQAAVCVKLANYQYQHAFVPDQELNFVACVAEVMECLPVK